MTRLDVVDVSGPPAGRRRRCQSERDYLDQVDKSGAFKAATADIAGEADAIARVLNAIAAYQAQSHEFAKVEPLATAASNLYGVAMGVLASASSTLKPFLLQLIREITLIQTDLASAEMVSARALRDDWGNDSDEIAAAAAGLRSRLAKYDPKAGQRGRSPQQGVYVVLTKAIEVVTKKETTRSLSLGGTSYNYGDPQTGVIAPDVQDCLDDFGQIERFLADKPLVLAFLQPLADATRRSDDRLAGMKNELRRKEKEAGFAPPQIPLGILPGEVFVDLLTKGAVLDDFGAGLQHGELSHRIQWYALIGFMTSGAGGYKWKYPPFELFKKINAPPFSPDRKGNSMWGTLLDKGTERVRGQLQRTRHPQS